MNMKSNDNVRNIAIIAHVDHGKTTLVDAMFRQSGLFREGQEVDERLMDSMDLEKERGITIAAKNCSINWKGVKINILDTPGHSDFGGEVERALSMVDGVILLVDASEGPLPQTRFVLDKALQSKLPVIVVLNKIDRPDARPAEVLDEVYSLLIDLDADDEQLECPVLYAIGKDGVVMKTPEERGLNLDILMDTILEAVPGPQYDESKPFQMLVSDLSYSDYLGRLAIGKVINGSVKAKESLSCVKEGGRIVPLKVSKIQVYNGTVLADAENVETGDIVVLSGIDDVNIGDTICHSEKPEALPRLSVDEPTVFMKFTKNTSPLSGLEGKNVQATKIYERLVKETLLNVSMQVERSENQDDFIVKGRGEFQMAILIETMRREGFELSVGRPQVIYKDVDGQRMEPIENLAIDCAEEYSGAVTEKLLKRKGRLSAMTYEQSGRVKIEFSVPSRSLIGYRDEFLTDTRGTGIMNSLFAGYEKYRGDFITRNTGSLVADRTGKAIPYALFNLEPRGKLFVLPGDDVYEGMIIGEYNKEGDLNVNACKAKNLTNVRASGKDDAVTLTPVIPMTLEQGLQFIAEDEMLEVTPTKIRLRKAVLSAQDRKVLGKRK
ncbi:translational GTPase TypA [Spirochaeta isovalerica]|uniref:Large ribosomal subunit assembly factor BipA n=1 Tax=Spirochaeta isovalerica TaxID=150 RepID=A0A841R6I9_9SPIO|nr:translational GTPase TypA [Spirochaeta isovalerica]MBB6478660.1 GTP-binding protein [Spirochaeta isovalerica]